MEKVRFGMVGGDMKAFIGEVHRKAISMNYDIELVAGCFSNIPEYNVETAETYKVDSSRVYDNYETMALEEGKLKELDFVSVCTPNFLHYDVCKKFLEAGINVVCEKPLCFEIDEAMELKKLADEKGLLFAVTYAYSGYTMVKVAKEMIKRGDIGKILTVNAEYAQDWLIDDAGDKSSKTAKLSVWRTDPKLSGISNCVGDIGTHIENTVHYMTGLEIESVSARLSNYGNPLDLNANMVVEYTNGVIGSYWSSQVAAGHLNGLAVRIFGTDGAIEWKQESPDLLIYTPKGEATRTLSRSTGNIDVAAGGFGRIPAGHPEGYHFGFANIYKNFANAVRAKKSGTKITDYDCDYPTVDDGINGVKFVHAVVESSNNKGAWTKLK